MNSQTASPQLAHMVYFTLIDNGPDARQRMIAACHKYLTVQPGIVYFSCGEVEPELDRPVNDREFDIALNLVFLNRAAHDAYQTDATHQIFINEQKSNWKKVRVFDSLIREKPA